MVRWLARGLPQIAKGRGPYARNVGDEGPVQRLAASRMVLAQEILKKSEEGLAVFVADPHEGTLRVFVGCGRNCEQQPLRMWTGAVCAQLFERVEREGVVLRTFDSHDDTEGSKLVEVRLLALRILLLKRARCFGLDPLAVGAALDVPNLLVTSAATSEAPVPNMTGD